MKQEHDAALAYFDGHCSVEHSMEIPDRSMGTWMVNAYAYLVQETGGSVLAARNHTKWAIQHCPSAQCKTAALINLGLNYHRDGRYNESIGYLDLALGQRPTALAEAQAHYNILEPLADLTLTLLTSPTTSASAISQLLGKALGHLRAAFEIYRLNAGGKVPRENQYHFESAIGKLSEACSRVDQVYPNPRPHLHALDDLVSSFGYPVGLEYQHSQ
jgi:tetratricopeptide (TPR) repeat protein